jgi:uncharacterized repeat protein (TIGR01451 family)
MKKLLLYLIVCSFCLTSLAYNSEIKLTRASNRHVAEPLTPPSSSAAFCSHPPCTNLAVTVDPSSVLVNSTTPCRGQLPAWYFDVTITETAGVGATVTDYTYQFFDSNQNPLAPRALGTLDFARDFNVFGGNIGRIRSFETHRATLCISFSGTQGELGYVAFAGTDDNNNRFCFSTPVINLLRPQNNQGADLSITNVCSRHPEYNVACLDTAASGANLLYTITIANNGPATATNVVVNDVLDVGTVFKNVVLTQGTFSAPPVGQTGQVSCSLGTLPPFTSATVRLVVNVTAPPGATLINRASVSSSTTDPDTHNNAASETTRTEADATAISLAKYSVTTSLLEQSLVLGKRATYNITVRREGPSNDDDAYLLEIPPPGTSFASAPGCVFSPHVGDTGIVLFYVGRIGSNSSATFSVTVNVVNSTGSAISDLTRIIAGGDSKKGFDFRGIPFDPCSGVACLSPADSSGGTDPTQAALGFAGGSLITLLWTIPSPSAGDPTPAPSGFSLGGSALAATGLSDDSISLPTALAAHITSSAEPCTLVGYKLYIGSTPALVEPTDSNVWKMIPPNVGLSSAPLPPGGAYYALVAVYRCPDGTIRSSQPTQSLPVNVAAGPTISMVSVVGKVLTISGMNLAGTPRVFINDVDETDFINRVSDNEIVLKGKLKKMNVRVGQNQIRVVNGGRESQPYVLIYG